MILTEDYLDKMRVIEKEFADAGNPLVTLDANDWRSIKETMRALWKVARAAEFVADLEPQGISGALAEALAAIRTQS